MKNTLVYTLILLSLVGCEISSKDTKKAPEQPNYGGMEPPATKEFTFAELEIGRRVCKNLENKKTLLEAYRLDTSKKIVFKAESQSCSQVKFAATADDLFAATVVLAGVDYELSVPDRSGYMSDIITTQSGVMKEVCEEIKSNDKVLRQLPISNSNFVIKFLVKDSYDRVEISQYSPDGKGGYAFNNVEGVSFVSSIKQGPKEFIGFEKERSRYTPCPGKKHPSFYIQTWMRDTTL